MCFKRKECGQKMIYRRGKKTINVRKDLTKCEVGDIVEFKHMGDHHYWSSILGIDNDWIRLRKGVYEYRPITITKRRIYTYCDVCRKEIDECDEHIRCKHGHDMHAECFENANDLQFKKDYLFQALEVLKYYNGLTKYNEFLGKIPTSLIESAPLYSNLSKEDYYDLSLLFLTRGQDIIDETEKAYNSNDATEMDRAIWRLGYDDEAFCEDGISQCLCPVCRKETK